MRSLAHGTYRWTFARLTAALAVLSGLGCSANTKQAGGLEVVIATDLPTPASFDAIHVNIEQRAADSTWAPPLLDKFYVIPSELVLPTTISIAAGSGPYQDVLITVTGLKGGLGGQDFVQRVVQTQVPTDRLAQLVLELASVCAGRLDCPVGDSCQPESQGDAGAGSCGSNAIDGSALTPYAPGSAVDAGLASTIDAAALPAVAPGDDAGDATTAQSGPDTSGGGDTEAAEGEASAGEAAAVVVDSGSPQGAPDAGADGAACTTACTVGQTQCVSGGVQTCELRPSGCTGWIATSTCGTNQTCTATGTSSSCKCSASACTQVGSLCQDAQTLATCAKDVDGCYYVASTSPCTAPESCSGMAPAAACSLTCSKSCTQDQASCMSTDLATCTLGSNGCLAYGPPQPCGAHQSCGGSAGTAKCSCTTDPVCSSASNVCMGSGPTYTICDQDSQGCFYAAGTGSCTGATPACLNGTCTACSPTTTECTSDTQVQTCGTDGQWGAATACADACVGAVDVVGGNCGGVCVPNATQCTGNAVETCGTSGQWGTAIPCMAAAPTCSQGACICPGGDAVSNGICCPAAQTGCSGTCVNEQNDANNCNACGHVCPYGLCQSAVCAASFFGPGHPTAGAGPPLSLGANTLLGDRLASGATSNVVAIGVQTVGAGISLRLGLYSDNGGKPGSLLTQTNTLTSVANGATEGMVTSTPVVVGTNYWVMILVANQIYVGTEISSTTWYYETGVAFGALPTQFSGTMSLSTNFGDLYFVTAP
jgi:hypothetical protein